MKNTPVTTFLSIANLLTGKKSTVAVSADGKAEFEISNPADYRLLRYEAR